MITHCLLFGLGGLLFGLFLFGVFIVVYVVLTIANGVRKMKKQFDHMMNGQGGASASGPYDDGSSPGDAHVRQDGNPPHRKIFADDEGEYIDFEEEK